MHILSCTHTRMCASLSAGSCVCLQEVFEAQARGRRSFVREQRESEELKDVRHQRCGTSSSVDTPASRVLTVRVCVPASTAATSRPAASALERSWT